jgi:hypothetical protein
MVFLGILALLFSIKFLDAAFNAVPVIDAVDFEFLLFMVAGILVVVGIFSLKAGDVTEGLLFMVVGWSAVIAFVTGFYGYGALSYFDWMVAFVIFIAMMILFVGRDLTLGIGVLFFLIGFVFALAFEGELAATVAGVTFLIAGIVVLYVAVTDWIYVETGADLPLL